MFHTPNQHRNTTHPTMNSDDSYGNNGLFEFGYGDYRICCIASDGEGWEHVSVSLNKQIVPTWEIMSRVKDMFWDEEDCVIQYHPPRSQYVNTCRYCLHLWRKIGFEFPIPNTGLVG